MTHNLRAKLSGLRHKGILEDKDYKRLCHALDLEKAEQEPKAIIREAIEDYVCNHLTDTAKAQEILNALQDLEGRGLSAIAEGTPIADNATNERMVGKWIKSRDSYGMNHFTCPFCEHDIATQYADNWDDNYCSNCGARMEGMEYEKG